MQWKSSFKLRNKEKYLVMIKWNQVYKNFVIQMGSQSKSVTNMRELMLFLKLVSKNNMSKY